MSFHRAFGALWADTCNVRCITISIIPDTPFITVFAFMTIVKFTLKVFNLLTLVGRCKGTLTVPLTHFSLPTLLWQGIQRGVSHSTPQGLLGRAVVPMRTLVAIHRLPAGGAAGLVATHC